MLKFYSFPYHFIFHLDTPPFFQIKVFSVPWQLYLLINPNKTIPNYNELLQIYIIDLLETRPFKMNLILFHKIMHNYVRIDTDSTYLIKRTITRGNEYKIYQQKATNIIRHNSLFIRVPHQYSQLPIELRKNTKNLKNFLK